MNYITNRNKFLIIVFIICSIIGFSFVKKSKKMPLQVLNIQEDIFQKKQGRILWNKNVKLKWEDFQGQRSNGKYIDYDAVSITGISEKVVAYEDSIVLESQTYFDIGKSWTTLKEKDLLIHEQGHFNIIEIINRKLRKSYTHYTLSNFNDFEVFYDEIYKKLFKKERVEMNALYDKETIHGKDLEAQKRWDIKITKMLEELEEYSNPMIVIKREIR